MEFDQMQPAPSKSERQWAMGCHLAALCGILVPVAAANLLGPLIIWLIKRVDGAFIDEQGKEALNFQISLFLYELLGWMLLLVGIGILIVIAVRVVGFILVIVAAVKVGDGVPYRYPACIRFIK